MYDYLYTQINWHITRYKYNELVPCQKNSLASDWFTPLTPPAAPASRTFYPERFWIDMGLSRTIKECKTFVPKTIKTT